MLGQFLLYTAVSLGFARLMARFKGPAIAVTGLFLVAVCVGADTRDWIWFDWAKRLSVIIPTFFLAIVNFVGEGKTAPPAVAAFSRFMRRWGFPGILMLNVSEGVLLDVTTGHWLIALTGLVCILTTPGLWSRSWYVDARGNLAAPVGWAWVALFTVWDANLFLSNVGGSIQNGFLAGEAILAAAFLDAALARNWPRWFVSRAYTLCLMLVVDSLWNDAFPITLTQPPAAPIQLACQLVGVALAVAAIVEAWRRRAGAPSAAIEGRGVVERSDRGAVPTGRPGLQDT